MIAAVSVAVGALLCLSHSLYAWRKRRERDARFVAVHSLPPGTVRYREISTLGVQ